MSDNFDHYQAKRQKAKQAGPRRGPRVKSTRRPLDPSVVRVRCESCAVTSLVGEYEPTGYMGAREFGPCRVCRGTA